MNITFSNADLQPLVEAVVADVMVRVEASRLADDGRLAYTEAEAAAMLGLAVHQLRDERRRGRVAASLVVGNKIRYSRGDLVAYLMRRRLNDPAAGV